MSERSNLKIRNYQIEEKIDYYTAGAIGFFIGGLISLCCTCFILKVGETHDRLWREELARIQTGNAEQNFQPREKVSLPARLDSEPQTFYVDKNLDGSFYFTLDGGLKK